MHFVIGPQSLFNTKIGQNRFSGPFTPAFPGFTFQQHLPFQDNLVILKNGKPVFPIQLRKVKQDVEDRRQMTVGRLRATARRPGDWLASALGGPPRSSLSTCNFSNYNFNFLCVRLILLVYAASVLSKGIHYLKVFLIYKLLRSKFMLSWYMFFMISSFFRCLIILGGMPIFGWNFLLPAVWILHPFYAACFMWLLCKGGFSSLVGSASGNLHSELGNFPFLWVSPALWGPALPPWLKHQLLY